MRTIAYYTFIEFIRKKILYVIIGIGCILMIATIIAGSLALTEQSQVIRDFGLGLIEIAGIILVLFFASNLLHFEISQNTIFLLASKNIKRSNIILGKYFGFAGIVILFTVLMSALYWLITSIYAIPFSTVHIIAIIGIIAKLLVLLAITLFFTTFVSPFVALGSSLILYFLGHIMNFVLFYVTILQRDIYSPFLTTILQGIYYILPNFSGLSIGTFFDIPFLQQQLPSAFSFALAFHILYVIIILFLAIKIFNKKQF